MSTARKLNLVAGQATFANKDATAAATAREPQRNRRVLIVEDEIAIADAYVDILSGEQKQAPAVRRSSRTPVLQTVAPGTTAEVPVAEEGFILTVVNSAIQALTAVELSIRTNQPFAMGFFDVLLGQGMDGVELVKKIHELDPNIYAVFVTAYSDRTVDSIRTLLGDDKSPRWDYLNKPFTRGEILQKARNSVTIWNLKTEKEQREHEIADLQKRLLENERSAAITTVSRSVTHEFGNILTQILGRSELGRKKDAPEMREALEKIYKASQQAADILERFKHLANPGTEKRSHHWFQLNQPIDEALELLGHHLKIGSIQICRVKSAKPAVFGDQTALLQVFVNLLVNAVHAMPHSGQIDISISESDGWAEVRVRDFGSGVEEKNLAKISEPFFTTKGGEGSGLGLAICKDIVEKEHGGRLILKNHEIKGFEAIVQVPIPKEEGTNE